ncbi:MAG: AAA family ATPase [Clostridia bacterium]|nr:AAA family ATPase [Clostridia bacterium]
MHTVTFAFTGKGGVGKTSLSAAMIRLLLERYPDKKILAIDADPAVGLATALAMQPPMTLDDVRLKIAASIDKGETADAVALLSEARFHLLDCMDERGNLSFLAIGRPEAAGCYCKVNAYLKQVIETISGNFDFVVIDGEAGIEQINRRVLETITCLVLVSDGSQKGIQVVSTIQHVASRLVQCEKSGVIFNRIRPGFALPAAQELPPVLAVIGDDDAQAQNDMQGESVFSLPDDAPLLRGAAQALDALLQENRP